jgi:hypothetical protein
MKIQERQLWINGEKVKDGSSWEKAHYTYFETESGKLYRIPDYEYQKTLNTDHDEFIGAELVNESIISIKENQEINCIETILLLEKNDKIKILKENINLNQIAAIEILIKQLRASSYYIVNIFNDESIIVEFYDPTGITKVKIDKNGFHEMVEAVNKLKESYDFDDVVEMVKNEPVSSKFKGLIRYVDKNREKMRDDIKDFMSWANDLEFDTEAIDTIVKKHAPQDTFESLPTNNWADYA